MVTVLASGSPSGGHQPRRRPPNLSRAGLVVFVLMLAYLLLMPLVQLQREALGNGAAGYRRAFQDPAFGDVIRTTLVVAAGSSLFALVLGTSLAILAQRLPRRMRFLQVLPVLPIVLPPLATTIGWLFLLSPRAGLVNGLLRDLMFWSEATRGPIDVNSLPWIVIASGFGLAAFVYAFVSAGIRNIGGELIEAATASGASSPMILGRIVLPLLRPTLVYALGVVFLLGLGQFTAPLLLGRQTGVDVLSTEVFRYVNTPPTDYAAASAAGSPLLLFGLAMVAFQRKVVGDTGRFVTHGGKSFVAPTRTSRFAPVAIVVYGVIALLLPVLALVHIALSPFWSGKLDVGDYSLDGVRTTLSDPRLAEAVTTSVTVSLIALALALPIGFVAASVLVRSRRFRVIRACIDVMVAIPLVVPATVLGAGFLMTYTQRPLVLYGSSWLIVLVYVALMVPYATRMQMAGLSSLGDHYEDAARVSGAAGVRRTLMITLPLMRPAIGGAAALMFVLLSHEFSVSLLVRTRQTQVMGTILYDFYSNGSYVWVATMALVMAAVTTVGLAVAFLIGGRRVLERL